MMRLKLVNVIIFQLMLFGRRLTTDSLTPMFCLNRILTGLEALRKKFFSILKLRS